MDIIPNRFLDSNLSIFAPSHNLFFSKKGYSGFLGGSGVALLLRLTAFGSVGLTV